MFTVNGRYQQTNKTVASFKYYSHVSVHKTFDLKQIEHYKEDLFVVLLPKSKILENCFCSRTEKKKTLIETLSTVPTLLLLLMLVKQYINHNVFISSVSLELNK